MLSGVIGYGACGVIPSFQRQNRDCCFRDATEIHFQISAGIYFNETIYKIILSRWNSRSFITNLQLMWSCTLLATNGGTCYADVVVNPNPKACQIVDTDLDIYTPNRIWSNLIQCQCGTRLSCCCSCCFDQHPFGIGSYASRYTFLISIGPGPTRNSKFAFTWRLHTIQI